MPNAIESTEQRLEQFAEGTLCMRTKQINAATARRMRFTVSQSQSTEDLTAGTPSTHSVDTTPQLIISRDLTDETHSLLTSSPTPGSDPGSLAADDCSPCRQCSMEQCLNGDVGGLQHSQQPSPNGAVKRPLPATDEASALGDKTVRDRRILETLVDRGRRFAARQTRRLVHKDGSCTIVSQHVTARRRRYLADIFTTLVDMRWRYNVVLFAAAFIVSWTTFAVVWFIIAYTHGDCRHTADEDWRPCISNVHDFPTALLFSIETQTTIGYGFRVIQPECPLSFFVLVSQSCIGVFIQSLMTGLIFSKLARPKQRAQTIMFSRLAVVCKRDNEYQLLFRVGNMRRSHIIATSIRAVLVKDRLTKEGETIPLCQYPLSVETQACNSNSFVFLVWPATVVHKVNSASPLWNISADQLLTERFEIIVILEGIVESTGMTTQMRTSYLPSEILWAHRLAPLLAYQKHDGQYRIDYRRFHAVEPIAMPDCSARALAETGSPGSGTDDDGDDPALTDFSAAPTLLSAAKPPARPGLPAWAPTGAGRSVIRRVGGGLLLRRQRSRRARDASHVITVADDVSSGDGGAPEVGPNQRRHGSNNCERIVTSIS